MNPELLLKHFDRISEAPDAVARLRRFILDLAVRGKLVEQDPADEPASELLKRIQAEKARLVKAGIIRSQKSFSQVRKDDFPFVLPNQWSWIQLGSVIHLVSGQHLQPPEYIDDNHAGVPYITGPSDFGQNGLVITRYALVRKAIAYKGQLLLTVKGSGVGKTTTCDLEEVAISRQLMALNSIFWDRHFLELVTHLLAETLRQCARSLIPGISREDVENFVVALPPLAEQHRIVAKVDELMALCDQLESARNEREAQRDRLTAASLHRIGTDAVATLPAAARFHLDHLPRLTTRVEHIKQLRQTILNLAVRGRLVPQDPDDEPAVELLKRIQVEKTRLVKEGAIKQQKPFTPARQEDLPEGWMAVNLAEYALDVCTGPFGSVLHQSDYIHGGIPLVNPSHMINDRILADERISVSPENAARLASYQLEPGDIVMARRGEVGRAALVEANQRGWLCGTGSFFLRLTPEINRRFFLTILRSTSLRAYLAGRAVGTTMVNLNHGILKNAFLFIPPLAEQHRIVAKVDELMALCDQLEAQLTTTETDSRRLLEAVLRDALAPALEEEVCNA